MSSDEDLQDYSAAKRAKLDVEEEEEIGDDEIQQINPLSLDHVLENVLVHLAKDTSSKEFLGVRFVCSQWSDVASGVYAKVHPPPTILFDCDRGNIWKSRFIEAFRPWRDDHAAWSLLKHFHFVFKAWFFAEKNNKKLWMDFLQDFSHCVGHLRLEFGRDFNIDVADWGENSQNIQFGRLKKLEIKGISSSLRNIDVEHNKSLGDLLKKIFSTAPLLSHLDLQLPFCFHPKGHRIGPQHEDLVLDALLTIFPRNLTHLTISSCHTATQFLTRASLPNLTSLLLQKGPGDDTSTLENLAEFLPKMSGHLETLIVKHEGKKEDTGDQINFVMKKLKKLEILGGTTMEWKFISHFPNLRELTYNIGSVGRWFKPQAPTIFPKYPPLKRLYINKSKECIPPHVISNMAKFFPSLSELHVNIRRVRDLKQIHTICQCFGRLESLILDIALPKLPLYNSEVFSLDPYLTGIHDDFCKSFVKSKYTRQLPQGVIRLPNLTNLIDLKHLKIIGADRIMILSSTTVHFALLRMENLKSLTMEPYHISPRYIERLRQRTNLLLLKPTYDKYEKSEQLEAYVK